MPGSATAVPPSERVTSKLRASFGGGARHTTVNDCSSPVLGSVARREMACIGIETNKKAAAAEDPALIRDASASPLSKMIN